MSVESLHINEEDRRVSPEKVKAVPDLPEDGAEKEHALVRFAQKVGPAIPHVLDGLLPINIVGKAIFGYDALYDKPVSKKERLEKAGEMVLMLPALKTVRYAKSAIDAKNLYKHLRKK
jgi:hypothetical protein